MITPSIMKLGSVSHFGPLIPSALSAWFTKPYCELSRERHTMPTAAAIVTYGRK